MNDLIVFQNGTPILNAETAVQIAEFERQITILKKKEDALKKRLVEEMGQKNIYKVETPELTVTFIDAFERESFDSKAFRIEHPDMYDEFVRFSPVSPSVRLKVK